MRSLLRLPSDYGLLCWVLVLWGTTLFWWVYGLLFLANLAILVAALPSGSGKRRHSGLQVSPITDSIGGTRSKQ
jgi:hypothetical protein